MENEQVQFPVHGSRVRWAVSQLRQQGIPFGVEPGAGGVYIIVIPIGYAPMVAGAPWAQPPQAASALRNLPVVQIAVAILVLVVAYVAFQAAPVLLASLPGDAAVVKEGGREGEGETGSNPLQAALDAVLSAPDRIAGEIDRRVEEAKQEVEQAIFNTAMMACGVPLLVVFGGMALLLVLRMVVRRR